MTRSDYAERHGLDNTAPKAVVDNLRAWCEAIGEPVRTAFGGKVVSVSSGYRSPAVNKAIGGNVAGQHPKGQAVDFEIFGVANMDLAKKIIELKLVFDQLILEHHDPKLPNSGWVHVSHVRGGKNRGQVLRAVLNGKGKTEYLPGLG